MNDNGRLTWDHNFTSS